MTPVRGNQEYEAFLQEGRLDYLAGRKTLAADTWWNEEERPKLERGWDSLDRTKRPHFRCPLWKFALLVLRHPCCAQCEAPWSAAVHPSVDHILPRSRGGSDDLENLQLLCERCNSAKGNRVEVHS